MKQTLWIPILFFGQLFVNEDASQQLIIEGRIIISLMSLFMLPILPNL